MKTSKTLVHGASRPWSRTHVALALLLTSLVAPASGWTQVLDMADLIAHSQQYDRKEVVVTGRAHAVQAVTDKQGKPAVQFLLEEGAGRSLKVICHQSVREGDQLIVEGTFMRRRQSGRMPVYNEVTATFIQPLDQLHPDLVG